MWLVLGLLPFFLSLSDAQCPTGTSLLFNNGRTVTCSPQDVCSCASIRPGFFCQFSLQNAGFVCCGSEASQCPNSSPLVSTTGNLVSCSGNSCPQGYLCNQGVCCADPNNSLCGTTPNPNVPQCLSGQVLVNGVCFNQVQIGALCQRTEQCLGNATCVSGRCQCGTGSFPVGGVCSSSSSQCPLGTTRVNGECISLASPGQQCISSNQCIDSSICTSGMCTCTTNARKSTQLINGYCIPVTNDPCPITQILIYGSQCVTYSVVSGHCQVQDQCVGGSDCVNGVCQCSAGSTAMYGYCIQTETSTVCNENQVMISGSCYNRVSQGGFCIFSQQCTHNGQCNNGVCQSMCSTGQVYVNGQCLNQVSIGGFCQNSAQCQGNSICTQGVCQCAQGVIPQNGVCGTSCTSSQVSVNGVCRYLVPRGDMCQTTEECLSSSSCISGLCQCAQAQSIINGACTGGVNGCSVGQVLINSRCVMASAIGSSCTSNKQCGGDSACLNGFCQCIQGTSQSNGVCVDICGTNQVYISGQCFSSVGIGASCQYTEQCQGDSQCTQGICQCPSGTRFLNGVCQNATCNTNQVLINNQCVQGVSIGGTCSFSQQCLSNSQCLNGVCQCPTGSTIQNGQCSTSNTCPQNQVLINNQCYQTVSLDGFCQFNEQCLSNSQCLNGFCKCPAGSTQQGNLCSTVSTSCTQYQVLVNGICLNQIPLGGQCSNTQQCTGNSECSGSFCRCSSSQHIVNGQCQQGIGSCGSNMVLINGRCQNPSAVGSSCLGNEQCVGNSQCVSSSCQCLIGQSAVNGICYFTTNTCSSSQVLIGTQCWNMIPVGYSCSFTQQCLSQSQCLNGICQCPSGSSLQNGVCTTGGTGACGVGKVMIANQCYNLVVLNGFCQFSQQCTSGSECSQGVCKCPSNTYISTGACTPGSNGCPTGMVFVNNQCMNPSSIGMGCSNSVQCLGSSFCSSGICQCGKGLQNLNGICTESSTTTCTTNQVLIGSQCYPTISVGGQCEFNQQCIGGSTCSNRICVLNSADCNSTQVMVSNQCLNKLPLNAFCSNNLQCTGGAQCTNRFCRCPINTYIQNGACFPGSNGCQPGQVMVNAQCRTPSAVGSSCVGSVQCLGNGACLSGICQCPSETKNINGMCVTSSGNWCDSTQVLVGTQCLNLSPISGMCSTSAQCTGGSQCSNQFCRCPTNMFIQNSVCVSGSNGCSTGQVVVNNQCLTAVSVGSSCASNSQCLGYSQCTSGRCQCVTGSAINGICSSGGTTQCTQNQVFVNGMCLSKVAVGASCQVSEQCLGSSECQNFVCSCPAGTFFSNGQCITNNNNLCQSYQVDVGGGRCLETVSIGQFCTDTRQCITGAQCASSSCQCGNVQTYNGTTCINSNIYCSPGTVLSSSRCLSLVQLGQFCQNSVQCMGFSQCTNSICICPSGTTLMNGVCRTNDQATQCPNNQVLIGTQCFNKISIGGFCSQTLQCQGNSTCQSGSCRCPLDMTDYGDGICRRGSQDQTTCVSANEDPVYNGQTLINCLYEACPSNSYCQLNTAQQKYICCRPRSSTTPGPSNAKCSNPSHSIVSENGVAVNCLFTTCPSNSHCEYSTQAMQYVCCRQLAQAVVEPQPKLISTPSSECKSNYVLTKTGTPVDCDVDGDCPQQKFKYCRRNPTSNGTVCCDKP